MARFIGLDRKGRPTLLLLGARVARHLSPAKRDRLLLHLLMQAEPLASASGDQGFALMLLHSDFNWDMDVAWLQEARKRIGADAPTLARKLGAVYVLRPTQWLRSLVGMARSMLKVSDNFWGKLEFVERDADLAAHFDLAAISAPSGAGIAGVAERGADERGLTVEAAMRVAAAADGGGTEGRTVAAATTAAAAAAGAAYDETTARAAAAARQAAEVRGAATEAAGLGAAGAEAEAVAEAAFGAAARARAAAAAEARAAAVAAARAAAADQVKLLEAEKKAAERDRDFYAARLDAAAATGSDGLGGGAGGAAEREATALQVRDLERQLDAANHGAEAVRAQCADVVRERHALKVQLGASHERLAEAMATAEAHGESESFLSSLRADAGGDGAADGLTVSRALVELQKALQRAVGDKVLAEQQRKLEREAARQEAAVARTEALQLRGEREAALGRLHAALEASHTLRCESPLHLPPTFYPPLSHPPAPRHPSTCTLLPLHPPAP